MIIVEETINFVIFPTFNDQTKNPAVRIVEIITDAQFDKSTNESLLLLSSMCVVVIVIVIVVIIGSH